MRLNDFSNVIPLALTTLSLGGAFDVRTVPYNEMTNGPSRVIESELLFDHINKSYLSTYDSFMNKLRFDESYRKWMDTTKFISSTNQIVSDESFLDIVEMGEAAIPFILNELEEGPNLLVWALNFIIGYKISDDPSVTISEASRMWVKHLKS